MCIRDRHYIDIKMYRRSTSKKRVAEAEKEARMEEKEATSAEDVEEMLLAIEDRQPEPAEEVQQPEGEPEITQKETQPEISQPEKPISTMDANILEILRTIKKMDENSRSTNQKIESLKNCLLYTSRCV